MYHLSGILGALGMIASLLLLLELGGCPVAGNAGDGTPGGLRILVLALAAVTTGVLSMLLHRRSGLDGSRPRSGGLVLAEAILMTTLGLGFLLGGFVWLHLTGGMFGCHIAGFVLGGYLTLSGLQRLREAG